MNWVGGARSRIKLQEEKKKQQDFFAKMRQCNRSETQEKIVTEISKPSISKDLLFLETIEHCVSQRPSGNSTRTPACVQATAMLGSDDNFNRTSHNIPSAVGNSNANNMLHAKPIQDIYSSEFATGNFGMKSRKRHSSCDFVPEDFQEFKQTPNTHPLDKFTHQLKSYSGQPSFDFRPFDENKLLLSKMQHEKQGKYLTQEAMLFAVRPRVSDNYAAVTPTVPLSDCRWRDNEQKPSWNSPRDGLKGCQSPLEFKRRNISEVQPPSSADRSIKNYIFYDSTEESPRETDKTLASAGGHRPNFRHHSTWAEPLKPKWLQAIGRGNSDSGFYDGGRCLRNRQALEFKSRLFSWSHEERTTRMEINSESSLYRDMPCKNPKTSVALVASTETYAVSDFRDVHYSEDPPSNKSIKQASRYLQTEKHVDQDIESFKKNYQAWLMNDICQQLCYGYEKNICLEKKIVSFKESSDSLKESILELSFSSDEGSNFDVVEICDQGTQMEKLEYEDKCMGTDLVRLLDVDVQVVVVSESKCVQTEELDSLPTKTFVSCAVQSDDNTTLKVGEQIKQVDSVPDSSKPFVHV